MINLIASRHCSSVRCCVYFMGLGPLDCDCLCDSHLSFEIRAGLWWSSTACLLEEGGMGGGKWGKGRVWLASPSAWEVAELVLYDILPHSSPGLRAHPPISIFKIDHRAELISSFQRIDFCSPLRCPHMSSTGLTTDKCAEFPAILASVLQDRVQCMSLLMGTADWSKSRDQIAWVCIMASGLRVSAHKREAFVKPSTPHTFPWSLSKPMMTICIPLPLFIPLKADELSTIIFTSLGGWKRFHSLDGAM